MTFADFLASSPTSYHAAATVAAFLTAHGFSEQREDDPWDSAPGGHYVVRDGAVIAYKIPAALGSLPVFRIVGTHTDSPGFKLKPRPKHESCGFDQAGMEVYGGPLLNSWLDREFGLAGRVVLTSGATVLVRTPTWLRIPQLAPHLDHTVNDSLHLNQQTHLMPVYALSSSAGDLMEAVAKIAGCAAEDIAGHDLFSYIPQPPEVFGLAGEFLAGGRMDNLTSVYPGMNAIVEAEENQGSISVLACFDHEEVGSSTRCGAAGPFLSNVLKRIMSGLGMTSDDMYRTYAKSWVVSSDAGHSVNPNYAEKYDPDERPIMGSGPMLKVNAKQRYTTDAPGEAMWIAACAQTQTPYQWFVSNNSVTCGTTIGPITATRLGIQTVDVGIPLLSMHSAREMCCPIDVDYLARAFIGFYQG